MRQPLSIRALGLAAGTVVLLAPVAGRPQSPTLGAAIEVDRPALVGAVGDQTGPASAHLGGGVFLVAWRTNLWEGEVRAARVTAAGRLLEPRGVVLPGLAGNDARVALAAGGGAAVAVGASGDGLQVVAIAGGPEEALAPGAPELLAATPGGVVGTPAVAWNGSSFWVAWSRSGAEILAARIDAGGRPLDVAPLLLSATPGHPALGWDGARTLAAWSTVVDGRVVVRAARLDGDGRQLDPQALELGELAGARAGRTAVASNGSLFLVAATGEAGAGGAAAIAAVRVTPAGEALDRPAIALAQLAAPPQGGPGAIWNGDRFLVLWGEPGSAMISPEGRLLGPDGAVDPLALPGLGAAGEQPVAVVGDGAALAFLARAPGGRGDLDIRGVRVGGDGAAAGGDFLVSAGLDRQGNPALAAGGPAGRRRLLLAWEDTRADRLEGDIHASLLDENGAPVLPEGVPLATGPARQRAPAVAWDGRAFQVIWHERGRGLVAARMDLEGAVLERPALLVPDTTGRLGLSDPVLCGDEAGALLVWSARAPVAAGAPRGELRALRITPGGTVRDGQRLSLLATHDVSTPPVMRLACAAEAALLLWAGLYEMDRSDAPDLQMALIPRRGEVGSPRVTVLERGTAEEGPAVASDGRGFLVAWRPRQENNARVAVFGTRVDATGLGLDRPARELGSLNAGHAVSAHWDGAQWVLAGIQALAVDDFQLRARRVRADLARLDTDWFPIDKVSSRRGTGALSTSLGLGGGGALIVYETFPDDDATGNQRLRARRLASPPLEPLDGAPDAGPPSETDAGAPLARVGGGGCACATERAPPAPPALLWAVILVALPARWRGARRRKPAACEADLTGV
jgi:MYXO-CTERM domain-containing protein